MPSRLHLKGLILAGGHGTPLRPLTYTGPKQLIPLANKPNILYCLENLRDARITDIAVILGDILPEKVKELLGDGSGFGVRITYIVQGFPGGIARGPCAPGPSVGTTPSACTRGTTSRRAGSIRWAESSMSTYYDAEVMLCHVPNPEKFGVAELDSEGR